MYMYIYMCIYTYIRKYIYICVYMCTCIYVYIHVYVCIHLSIYTAIQDMRNSYVVRNSFTRHMTQTIRHGPSDENRDLHM